MASHKTLTLDIGLSSEDSLNSMSLVVSLIYERIQISLMGSLIDYTGPSIQQYGD